jgi:ech hydrogenase subunit D
MVEVDRIIPEVENLKKEGYRLVQMHCMRTKEEVMPNGLEINYTFDKDYNLETLRVIIGQGQEIPSISAIYPGAFLYENEMHDLFGVKVNEMSIDYKGRLYQTAVPTPFVEQKNETERQS